MKRWRNGTRERRALGLSVLLHACVAPLFVAMLVGSADLRPEAAESQSGMLTISLVHRAAARPQQAPRSAAAAPVHQAVAMVRIATPHLAAATQRRPAGSHKARRLSLIEPVVVPSALPTGVRTAQPASERVSALHAETGASAAPAGPTSAPATAQPTASPIAVAATVDASIGGWGQNFREPTVLDDDALAAIRARYPSAIAHIDVDEDGRATHVSVDSPGIDADGRADIERRLMALHYVPAESNGLRVARSFDLRV